MSLLLTGLEELLKKLIYSMKDLRESGNMKIGKLIYENFELCRMFCVKFVGLVNGIEMGFGTVLDQK